MNPTAKTSFRDTCSHACMTIPGRHWLSRLCGTALTLALAVPALATYPQHGSITSATYPGTTLTATINTTGVQPVLSTASAVANAQGSNINNLADPDSVLSELPPSDSNYYGLGYTITPGLAATTTYTFNKPVVNPIIHVLMMSPARITVTGANGGSSLTPTLTKLAGNTNLIATGNLISSSTGGGGICSNAGGNPGCGSFRAIGTFTSVTLAHANPVGSGSADGFVSTVAVAMDYGDAPASYGNASHSIHDTSSQGFYLGAARPDAESASQATATANGDDVAGVDDEDGITGFAPLYVGATSYSADVVVHAPAGSAGTLIGWIDFNRNGSFEPAEGASTAVPANSNGATANLTWPAANPASAGTTYARFRISNDASLTTSAAIGTLSDGEVEDYALTIQTLPRLTLRKISVGGVDSFGFTGTNGVATQGLTTTVAGTAVSGTPQFLTAASTATTITESTSPASYRTTAISCTGLGTGGVTTVDLANRRISLDAAATAAGADIVCTFTNTLQQTDIQVVKTATPNPVAAGQVVTYNLVATNNGPLPVSNAVLTDAASPGQDCTMPSTTATCTASGGASCPSPTVAVASLLGAGITLPTLPVGGQITVVMQCTVTATGAP